MHIWPLTETKSFKLLILWKSNAKLKMKNLVSPCVLFLGKVDLISLFVYELICQVSSNAIIMHRAIRCMFDDEGKKMVLMTSKIYSKHKRKCTKYYNTIQ